MKLALLNTSILTSEGSFSLRTISQEEAYRMVREFEIDSAIGHESTAQIMSALLDIEVPVNRQIFVQRPMQQALVFKLNGRPPEGKVLSVEEIKGIGYKWQLLTMYYTCGWCGMAAKDLHVREHPYNCGSPADCTVSVCDSCLPELYKPIS